MNKSRYSFLFAGWLALTLALLARAARAGGAARAAGPR
jgi:hypothetical protein